MPTPDREILVPAALAKEIADVLEGAINSSANDAERVEEAPESDGYTDDDIQVAKDFIDDVTRVHDAFRQLLEKNEEAHPEARWDGNRLVCGHEGCGGEIAQLNEGGYERSWNADVRGRRIHARFNGSGDWSDDGDGLYTLTCAGYLHVSSLPADFDESTQLRFS